MAEAVVAAAADILSIIKVAVVEVPVANIITIAGITIPGVMVALEMERGNLIVGVVAMDEATVEVATTIIPVEEVAAVVEVIIIIILVAIAAVVDMVAVVIVGVVVILIITDHKTQTHTGVEVAVIHHNIKIIEDSIENRI